MQSFKKIEVKMKKKNQNYKTKPWPTNLGSVGNKMGSTGSWNPLLLCFKKNTSPIGFANLQKS